MQKYVRTDKFHRKSITEWDDKKNDKKLIAENSELKSGGKKLKRSY